MGRGEGGEGVRVRRETGESVRVRRELGEGVRVRRELGEGVRETGDGVTVMLEALHCSAPEK